MLVIISKTLTAHDLDVRSEQRSVIFENDLWRKMLPKKLDMSGYCWIVGLTGNLCPFLRVWDGRRSVG
jgi:hypothetical protein